MVPGLDLCDAHPAQDLTMAGEEQDYLDYDLICPRCEHMFTRSDLYGTDLAQHPVGSVWHGSCTTSH